MFKLVRKVMPREERFFDMFEKHAAVMVQASDALARLLEGSDIAKAHDELASLENEADDITAEVLTAVRRSFITPFDRSAITHLITAMDDAVDEMWHTAKNLGDEFYAPLWVVISAQAAMGLGTLMGGWRIVHTMGSKITRLNPHQGFSAETDGAFMLFTATSLGVPVSTTHTITGCIMGVGAARRASAVRWGIAGNILIA